MLIGVGSYCQQKMSVRQILVEGFPEDTDEEMVVLLFENWRIGGGDVEKVQLIGHGAAYVTFADPSGTFVKIRSV